MRQGAISFGGTNRNLMNKVDFLVTELEEKKIKEEGIQIRLGELINDLNLKWRMFSLRDVEMLLPISAIRKCFCTAASYHSSLS